MQQSTAGRFKNPPDRTYASLRSDLVSNDQLRNWQIVLKKSGDGRKLSGTLTRVARGDGGADDDYCCPDRKGTGARGNSSTISPTCPPRHICARSCHHQGTMDLRTGPSAAEEKLGLDHLKSDPGKVFIVTLS